MSQTGQPGGDAAAERGRAPHDLNSLHRFFRAGSGLSAGSPGEYLLPFFLALMEACWLNAILIGLAGLKFLHSSTALLPFWGPPLLLCASLWLFRRAMQQEALAEHEQSGPAEEQQRSLAMPGLRPLFGLLALLTIGLIWLHIYAPTSFFFDPAWLLTLANDLLALNDNFYQALTLIAITTYCCWRGMRLAQMTIEPGFVFRRAWAGLLVLLAAMLLRAGVAADGSNSDDVVLVLLIPLFLYLALSTHALARITFIRHEHPFGLEGNVITQERATLSMISGVGLVLLILTMLCSVFFSPAFFASLQPFWNLLGLTYDTLVRAFSQLIVWILTPVYWLFTWWSSHFLVSSPHTRPITGVRPLTRRLPLPAPTSLTILLAAKILLPLLIFLLLGLLIYLTLRRRRRLRIALNLKGGDIHESVWSWQLFLRQFKAFWWGLLQRFFPRKAPAGQELAPAVEQGNAPPAVRTIREIYRALLQKAASRGHRRKRAETPHEFRQRLHAHEPWSEPQLGQLTEVYTLARYGGISPAEEDLEAARRDWHELEQKWETLRE
ncbi:MAG TPA: DUF4129 domain-containing protein [Ktedonobacteraceae bacterium]|jgi:hypothetical protein